MAHQHSASNAAVVIGSEDEFHRQLEAAGPNLVIVEFCSEDCEPCKRMDPKLQEMARDNAWLVFLKVDVDVNPELVAEYEVSTTPTFMLIKNKKRIIKFADTGYRILFELIHKHK